MCDECHQHPHATMCPMNPALADDDPIMKRCPICEREFPEEDMTWSVCDECLEKHSTDEIAMEYGKARKTKIEINGMLEYAFSESDIEEALTQMLAIGRVLFPDKCTGKPAFLYEDRGDFADWLVEQKKGGG